MTAKLPQAVDVFVGKRIRMRRLEIGLGQKTLGETIGITFQQIQKYENGTNRVTSSRIMQIADVLKVPPTFFFEGVPRNKTDPSQKTKAVDYVSDFVRSKDGLALLKAFMKVPKSVRRSIVEMVEKIADLEKQK